MQCLQVLQWSTVHPEPREWLSLHSVKLLIVTMMLHVELAGKTQLVMYLLVCSLVGDVVGASTGSSIISTASFPPSVNCTCACALYSLYEKKTSTGCCGLKCIHLLDKAYLISLTCHKFAIEEYTQLSCVMIDCVKLQVAHPLQISLVNTF